MADGSGQPSPTYRRMSQAKVVLLGDVGAGKTSFLNALRYGQPRLAPGGRAGRTIGIEVHSVDISHDARLWFYDFGGHETYHFSQGLFLTDKAIYMLMVDIASYSDAKFQRCVQYWYTVLTAQLVSPVICVLATHIDQCPAEQVTTCCRNIVDMLYNLEMRHLARIRQQLHRIDTDIEASLRGEADPVYDFQANSLKQPREKLENILLNRPRVFPTICKVSSKTLEGIPTATQILLDVLKNNSDSFPQCVVAEGWLRLGDSLAARREEVPFVHWAQFQTMGRELGVDRNEIRQALKYLQTTGIVLHYEDYKKQSDLRDLVFNNTNLLLSIFGLIFNHNYFNDEIRYIWHNRAVSLLPRQDLEALQRNLRREGIIGEKLLRCFWASLGLTDDVIHAVMSLLEKFDLCYEVSTMETQHLPAGRHFRFPYLLKPTIPLEAETIWPPATPDGFSEYQLLLTLEMADMPVGFLEKVSVRINPYLDRRADWKYGIVAFCNDGLDMVKLEVSGESLASTGLTLRARVRRNRRDLARHILLLLVAVINKVLLRQYPGLVGFWYVGCSHCVALKQSLPGILVDMFPADNLVFTMAKDLSICCRNCTEGEVLKASDVFPTLADSAMKMEKMSVSERLAMKSSQPRLAAEVDARQLLTVLLKQGVIDLKQAEDVACQQPNDRRMEKLLKLLSYRGHRAFLALCRAIHTDGESPPLAQHLMTSSKSFERRQRSVMSREGEADKVPNQSQSEAAAHREPQPRLVLDQSSFRKRAQLARAQEPMPWPLPTAPRDTETYNGGGKGFDTTGKERISKRVSFVGVDDKSNTNSRGQRHHMDLRNPAPLESTEDAISTDAAIDNMETALRSEDGRAEPEGSDSSMYLEADDDIDPVFPSLAWRIFCLVGARKNMDMNDIH